MIEFVIKTENVFKMEILYVFERFKLKRVFDYGAYMICVEGLKIGSYIVGKKAKNKKKY